jgi:glucans biosynthesis protein C
MNADALEAAKEARNGRGPKRLAYLDNLRTFVVLLVVVAHSNVTYGGYGNWYYKETDSAALDFGSRIAFGLFGSFTQAWFMGALFFISAFLAAKSLARRGPRTFVRERLLRLGLPVLAYMLFVEPFIYIVVMGRGLGGTGRAYLEYLSSPRWLFGTGPLWFAEILLLFSLAYAAWRSARPARKAEGESPRTLTLVLVILAVGLAAFSIRLFIPIGTSYANFLLGNFASYVALFILGLHAGERDWLEAHAAKGGMGWFRAALEAGLPLWFIIMGVAESSGGSSQVNGGLNGLSLAFAFWEAFVAVGLSLGVVGFFRRYISLENGLTRFLAANSFGVYMFHAPVLIAFSLLLRAWAANPLLKHAAVWPLAIMATLALSAFVLRRIPGLRSLLK